MSGLSLTTDVQTAAAVIEEKPLAYVNLIYVSFRADIQWTVHCLVIDLPVALSLPPRSFGQRMVPATKAYR